MSKFVLRPARLRDGKFIPEQKSEPMEIDWASLVRRFSPARTKMGTMILRGIRPGMFIGTRNRGKDVLTFSFDAAGRSRSAAQVLKTDPSFADSIIDLFYVDSVNWDMKLQEL